MEQLTDLAMWVAIVGFFMPLVVALIQQPKWQPATRAIVAAIASGIAGAGTVYFTTPDLFNTGVTTTVILTVIMASTATYRSFWKSAGIRHIEDLTSPGDDTLDLERAVAADSLRLQAQADPFTE